ncbi:sensor histidine kinase [Streptomyces hoynatensis]|uniref:histidine kinase n=1 Tax=Streptomyces hoynatensis TaxID=1141874 RepID=A0A3A9YPF4_9ACTN|nr:sensor histidine kinase [Streptomyces hoynatensis]RKN37354.1 sensor histidine kinase [Streptomyces hoynatensis]
MNATGAAAQERGFRLWWWTRRRGVALDVGLALASAGECAAQGVGFAHRTGVPVWLVVLLAVPAGGTLVVRRRWPLAVILVSIAVLPANMGALLDLVGLYTLTTTEVPRRVIVVLGGMAGAGTALVTYLLLERDENLHEQALPVWFSPLVSVLFGVATAVPPVLLGMYVRARRRLVESLRDRAHGLERELALLAERAEERAEWARGEERRRIAREMHDVVAHRVSLMVVHAAAVQAVAPKEPEKAARNAALIGDMGRQALTELRTMLGVLRAADRSGERSGESSEVGVARSGGAEGSGGAGGSVGAVGGSAGVGSASGVGAGSAVVGGSGVSGVGEVPGRRGGRGPALAEVSALVDQSRAAGMAVVLAVEGEPRGYAEQVESTAYRVVQEALTNVHKHAAGAAAQVRLAHREGEVAVLVLNEAPVDGKVPGGGARLPSGGNGLVGMRERVMALGGGFVSGPTEGGGFRVSAVIPDRRGSAGG